MPLYDGIDLHANKTDLSASTRIARPETCPSRLPVFIAGAAPSLGSLATVSRRVIPQSWGELLPGVASPRPVIAELIEVLHGLLIEGR